MLLTRITLQVTERVSKYAKQNAKVRRKNRGLRVEQFGWN